MVLDLNANFEQPCWSRALQTGQILLESELSHLMALGCSTDERLFSTSKLPSFTDGNAVDLYTLEAVR